MVNEFFVVHIVADYEGHYHLSVHGTYELALSKAQQLVATEVCVEHVYITRGEVGCARAWAISSQAGRAPLSCPDLGSTGWSPPSRPAANRTVRPWREQGFLLRLHVGLEAVEDLITDLDEGFARLDAVLRRQEAPA